MTTSRHVLKLHTHHEGELIDLTNQVQNIIKESKSSDGVAFLFVPGSTAALTTIEFEPGLEKDFPAALERLVPKSLPYQHEKTWHDGNGHSHVKASLLGPDLTVPFQNGKLSLGTWQQIAFVELDTTSRERTVIIQLLTE
jgi:secondary thiamine-phosphate synthase enzyme